MYDGREENETNATCIDRSTRRKSY
jgi:hypothetical protein